MRHLEKTSAPFEAKLLRGGVFCPILAPNGPLFPIPSIFWYPPLPIQQFNRFALYGRSEGLLSSLDVFIFGGARNLPGRFPLVLGRGFFRVPGEGNLNHPEQFTFRMSRWVCPREIRTGLNPLDETVNKGCSALCIARPATPLVAFHVDPECARTSNRIGSSSSELTRKRGSDLSRR